MSERCRQQFTEACYQLSPTDKTRGLTQLADEQIARKEKSTTKAVVSLVDLIVKGEPRSLYTGQWRCTHKMVQYIPESLVKL